MTDETNSLDGCGKADCNCAQCNCSKASNLLYSYLDDILAQADKDFINQHLNDCPGCKGGYEFETNFRSRLRSLKPVCVPQEVKNQIMLSLGFPGMTNNPNQPISLGIPKGEIPSSPIPGKGILPTKYDLSSEEQE